MKIFYQANQIFLPVETMLVSQMDGSVRGSMMWEGVMSSVIHDGMVTLTKFRCLDWQAEVKMICTVRLVTSFGIIPKHP